MGATSSKLGKIIGAKSVIKKRLSASSSSSSAPKGYVPICVGINDDIKRFVVHTKALRDAEFLQLLRKSAEEYGFRNDGVLRIPYEANDFEEWIIRKATFKIISVKPMEDK
ncbi:SAUR-like auxin-responsive protein family [Euphorbia peplus]|nr:SAUR-like auxin-responsive protein family [Euphorbia peplus]